MALHSGIFYLLLLTAHRWYFRGTAIGVALEAKLDSLAGAHAAVPGEVGSAVGVRAGNGCIPAAGQAVGAVVLPAGSPAVEGTGAVVGDTNSTGKACPPGIAHDISTADTTASSGAG